MAGESLPNFGGTVDGHEPTQSRVSFERTASGKLVYKITVGIGDSKVAVNEMADNAFSHFRALEAEARAYEREYATEGK